MRLEAEAWHFRVCLRAEHTVKHVMLLVKWAGAERSTAICSGDIVVEEVARNEFHQIMECFGVLWGATLSGRVIVYRRFEGPWQQLQVESSTKEIDTFLRSISRKVKDRHGSYVTTIYARVLLCRLTWTRIQTKALTATAELLPSLLRLHLLSFSDLFYAYFRHIDRQPSHFICLSSS